MFIEHRRALRIIAGTVLWTSVAFGAGRLLTDEKGAGQDTSSLLRVGSGPGSGYGAGGASVP